MKNKRLTLKGFTFDELLTTNGLSRLDFSFLDFLKKSEPSLVDELQLYRTNQLTLSAIELSDWLIKLSIYLEKFLAELFDIEYELEASQIKTTSYDPIAVFKKYFVLKRAKKEVNRLDSQPSYQSLDHWLNDALSKASLQTADKELAVALLGQQFLSDIDQYKDDIEKLVAWCAHILANKQLDWTSFRIPLRIEPFDLVACEKTNSIDNITSIKAPDALLRERDGFKLTDARMNAREVQNEVHYCIYCHDHEGDFCSKGFPVKKGDPTQGYKKNAHQLTLTGCPLEEKISEMHQLKRDGYTIAALAMIMIDNPMCPATGHRICNDCMKACIYQKQDPVNIPQIETRVLTDALSLPFGVELYDLMTRWHPLRQTQWIMKPYNGLKVLIAGMGPAGFTLAHHLLLEGFAVVGFDGLKIEPLPQQLLKTPVYSFDEICDSLDERIMAGFGGVAEYGITVRWDKNFLKLIYLSLMRRPYFQVFGGIRFGGTITVESAFNLQFDHVVVAVGAGLPKALRIENSMAPNMRQANDFLMALQLGNAAKKSSLNNLEVRLPAVVIGGGLTGIDTATEVQAYYVTMVEKILYRYEKLISAYGEKHILNAFDEHATHALSDYLSHAKAIKQERQEAKNRGESPKLIPLLHELGGVTIVYRRSMQESPAYIYNHEELQNALKEGIFYIEHTEPVAALLDNHGFVTSLVTQHKDAPHAEKIMPAKSIFVATGTQPNTAYEFEHKGTFNRIQLQYQHYEDIDGHLQIAHGVSHTKEKDFGPFTSYNHHGHRVSLIGDTHPVFHGNVVKAIASGMRTYPKITALFKEALNNRGDQLEYAQFADKITELFRTRIVDLKRVTKNTIELTVHAPLAAKQFKPGQFFRIQNLETTAIETDDTLLQMEALALPAAECDPHTGLITFIIKEETTSSKLVSTLKVNDPISLMGPTGVRAKLSDDGETILILGQAAAFAFIRHYGLAAKKAGNRVLFVCEIDDHADLFCQEALRNATDQIIWVTTDINLSPVLRPQDMIIQSNCMINALTDYSQQNHTADISLKDIDRVFVIGPARLLKTFQKTQTALKSIFVKEPKIVGSVYGNMQCMLKGVCAQCLQWQIDPDTGLRTKAVFACSWQDQPLELIDIPHLETRQKPSAVLDTLNQLWVNYLFDTQSIERI